MKIIFFQFKYSSIEISSKSQSFRNTLKIHIVRSPRFYSNAKKVNKIPITKNREKNFRADFDVHVGQEII